MDREIESRKKDGLGRVGRVGMDREGGSRERDMLGRGGMDREI